MPHGTRNKQISPLKRTKTGDIQPKLNVACFVQSCLTDADFVLFSNYCLIGTRQKRSPFLLFSKAGGGLFLLKNNRKRCVDGETAKRRPSFHHHNLPRERNGRFACEPSVLCRAQTQRAKVQQAYDRADVFRQRLPRRRPFAA